MSLIFDEVKKVIGINTLENPTVFDVTNVYEYVQSNTLRFQDYITFPVTPPFPSMFFEWARAYSHGWSRIGIWLRTLPFKLDAEGNKSVLPLLQNGLLPRWVCVGQEFLEDRKERNICYAQNPFLFWVLPDGCAVSRGGRMAIGGLARDQRLSTLDHLIDILGPMIMGLLFSHCRNVKVREVSPSRHERRLAQRTRTPVWTHYVLEINPMKELLKQEGYSETRGIKYALHICRGHFANYTEGKGLFGKYHGQYWIPQHVRGSAEQGIVEKDYEVKAPNK